MYLKVLLNVFMLMMLSSCSTLSIEKKNLISIVGFDQEADKIKITALMVNPTVLGKTQMASKQAEKPESLLMIEGHTIDYTTHQASRFIPRHVDWNHTQVVIIGEDLAKNNFQQVMNFFSRQPESITTPYIFISKGETSRSLLKKASKFIYPPSFMLKEITEPTKEHVYIQPVRVKDVLNELNSNLTDIVIPSIQLNQGNYITSENNQPFMIADSCVVHKGKFAGWLGQNAAEGFIWVNGNAWDHSFQFFFPEHKLFVNFDVSDHKKKKSANFSGNKLQNLVIDVSVKGRITELSRSDFDLAKLTQKEVENKISSVIKNKVQNAIDFSKDHGNDMLGFGYQIRKENQKYWSQNKEQWGQTIYHRIPVEVDVSTLIEDWGDLRKKNILN